jgi:PAS domain S-box-containing protein
MQVHGTAERMTATASNAWPDCTAGCPSARFGIYTLDLRSRCIECDRVMREMLGFGPEDEISVKALSARIPMDDLQVLNDTMRRALHARQEARAPFRVRCDDGPTRHLLASGRVLCDGEGKPVRVVGSAIDLTREFNALSPFDLEPYGIAAVLDHAPDMLAMLDLGYRYLYVSPSAKEVCGRTAAEFLHRTCEEAGLPPLQCRLWRRHLDAAAATGERQQVEYTGPAPDGSERTWLARFIPVHDGAGRVTSLINIVTDVTRYRAALRELEVNQLRLAEADRAKDVFIATLAHELRNPITPIRFALDSLRRSPERRVREAAQNIIERQLSHLVGLVDDLLDLSRIREGKFALRLACIDVRDNIDAAIEAVAALAEEKQQVVHLDLPDESLVALADPLRITQVLTNVLRNAVKYTPPGGRITVAARRTEEGTCMEVQDTGQGIAEENLEKVFDLFAQEGMCPERAGGLGIGLALVRRLVEKHGGTVRALSAGLGAGTTIRITLPRYQPH